MSCIQNLTTASNDSATANSCISVHSHRRRHLAVIVAAYTTFVTGRFRQICLVLLSLVDTILWILHSADEDAVLWLTNYGK